MPIEEENQRSNLMILPVTLEDPGNRILTYTMADTGAEGKGFIDQDWANDHNLTLIPLERPFALEVFDGREAENGRVTHYVRIGMRIHDHYQKRMIFYVTQLAHYPIVLSLPWLKEHDLVIGFAAHSVQFNSEFCYKNCNTPSRPTKIRALHDMPSKARPKHLPPRPVGLRDKDIGQVSLRAYAAYARRNYHLFTVTVEDIEIALQ
jgi:hypothetical protein